MRSLRALVVLLALTWMTTPDASAMECEQVEFEGMQYDQCTVDLAKDELRLWLDDTDGAKLLSLGKVAAATEAAGSTLAFAMNAGMYHEDRGPVGHLMIDGKEHRSVMTRAGPGNFGMLPNGVFCWDMGKAYVVESRTYAKSPPKCRHATQSGPMLVIQGKLHPRFLPDSTSFRLRNGVGVAKDGRTATFVISRFPVTFHSFARYFRDRLKTPNALYLDGSISRMYAPTIGRKDRGGRFGPIVGVVTRN